MIQPLWAIWWPASPPLSSFRRPKLNYSLTRTLSSCSLICQKSSWNSKKLDFQALGTLLELLVLLAWQAMNFLCHLFQVGLQKASYCLLKLCIVSIHQRFAWQKGTSILLSQTQVTGLSWAEPCRAYLVLGLSYYLLHYSATASTASLSSTVLQPDWLSLVSATSLSRSILWDPFLLGQTPSRTRSWIVSSCSGLGLHASCQSGPRPSPASKHFRLCTDRVGVCYQNPQLDSMAHS